MSGGALGGGNRTDKFFPTRSPIWWCTTAVDVDRDNEGEDCANCSGDENADAPSALFDLLGNSGAAKGLKQLGLAESALDEAADRIMIDRYFNLRDYDRTAIRAALQAAWEGRPPVSAV